MKHPFSTLAISKEAKLLFCAVQNNILLFDLKNLQLLDQWSDNVGIDFTIKKQFEQKIEDQASKKQKLNDSKVKIPKIPTPGPGAPQVYNDIKNLFITPSEDYLIATTNSDKAAIIFEIKDRKLKLIKRQPFPKRPCSVSVTKDEKKIIVGDKFGDVYSITINGPVYEINEKNLESNLDNNDYPKLILGHVSMLTTLLMTNNNQHEKLITADRDEHIKISNYPKSFVIDKFLFGHKEFISQLIIPEFNPKLLISAGGDEEIFFWNWMENDKPLTIIPIKEHVLPYLTEAHQLPERWIKTDEDKLKKEYCISRLLITKDGKLIILPEQTRVLLIFKVSEDGKSFNFEKLIEDEDLITDIVLEDDTLYYAVDSETDKLLQKVDLKNYKILSVDIESPVEVESRDAVYPLYPMSVLRKRSEH